MGVEVADGGVGEAVVDVVGAVPGDPFVRLTVLYSSP
jgi:hypothetical protein